MNNLNIGQIIEGEQHRDAIHAAIAPVVAAHTLIAGRHVALDDSGHASEHTGKPAIGIIDPFLTQSVESGQKCWLFLYPGTITALRHEWTHPAFEAIAAPPPAAVSDAESWLRDYAERVDADYDEMMRVAATHCLEHTTVWPDYLIEGGKWEGESVPDEFWVRFAAVTGKTGSGSFFSCSC